ncbi:MAG: L-histidine N(alpha)-methyltransferase [Alphaproteobacteria bacterium]
MDDSLYYGERPITFLEPAREIFRGFAGSLSSCRKHIAAEWAPQLMGFAAGFAQDTPMLSMADSYAASGWGGAGMKMTEDQFAALLKKQLEFGDLPGGGRKIPSNEDVYNEGIAMRDYYTVRRAEHSIIDSPQNRDYLAGCVDGHNVVFVCVGSGDKESKIIRRAMAAGANIGTIVINDTVKACLQIAKAAFTERGYTKKVVQLHGNIFSPHFQQHPIWAQLTQQKKPITVVMLGATEGNFTDEELGNWLNFLNKTLRAGDRLLVGANNTEDLETVTRSYDHHYYKQFTLSGFVFACQLFKYLPQIDINALDVRIDIASDAHARSITAGTRLIIKEPQNVGFPIVFEAGELKNISVRITNESAYTSLHSRHNFSTDGRMRYMPTAHYPQDRAANFSIWGFRKGSDFRLEAA